MSEAEEAPEKIEPTCSVHQFWDCQTRFVRLETRMDGVQTSVTDGFKDVKTVLEGLKANETLLWSGIKSLGAIAYRILSVTCLTVLVAHVSHADPLTALMRVLSGKP